MHCSLEIYEQNLGITKEIPTFCIFHQNKAPQSQSQNVKFISIVHQVIHSFQLFKLQNMSNLLASVLDELQSFLKKLVPNAN
jgi:hypothetical protein